MWVGFTDIFSAAATIKKESQKTLQITLRRNEKEARDGERER